MKSTIISVFSIGLLLSSCNDNHNQRKQDKGWIEKVTNTDHGPVREREFKGDFDEIEVSQAIEAEIIKSDAERVVISAPENIIDEVLVENTGKRLHIHYKSGIRVMNSSKVKAKIYTRDFTKLIANSAAKIMVQGKFTQEKTDIDASSSGSISGHLEANDLDLSIASSGRFEGKIWAVDLDVEASSAANVIISGKAKNVEISSSSGSSVSAKDVMGDHVDADASSGASVEISAVSMIKAEASSGGSIHITKKGNVTDITKEESSGGSVTID